MTPDPYSNPIPSVFCFTILTFKHFNRGNSDVGFLLQDTSVCSSETRELDDPLYLLGHKRPLKKGLLETPDYIGSGQCCCVEHGKAAQVQ